MGGHCRSSLQITATIYCVEVLFAQHADASSALTTAQDNGFGTKHAAKML
jgi:hypothetical protein